jgi:hypothetical protein
MPSAASGFWAPQERAHTAGCSLLGEVIMSHENVLNRLRAEYLEMPGLRLKREQVQRLFGVERAECQRVLDTLVETKFLYVKADGTYARLTDDTDMPRPQPAKASLGAERRLLKES